MKKKIGLLGYGYVASHLAKRLVSEGYQVWGTSRKITDLKYDVAPGVEIIDFNQAAISNKILDTSELLISIPPGEDELDPAWSLVENLHDSVKQQLQWIGYLSSTGVYGDYQGQWVDESADCNANTQRTKKRVSAEQAWLSLNTREKLPVMIFRLSGIYGPRRNALEQLMAGKDSIAYKSGQYFSRIHVTDICAALYQSMLTPMPGEIFNVTDDYPCNNDEVYHFAAQLLNLTKPNIIPYTDKRFSAMLKTFYTSNRRVSNAKLKKYLLATLTYPDYRQGLQSIYLALMNKRV